MYCFRAKFINRFSILGFPFPLPLKNRSKNLGWCLKQTLFLRNAGASVSAESIPFSCQVQQDKGDSNTFTRTQYNSVDNLYTQLNPWVAILLWLNGRLAGSATVLDLGNVCHRVSLPWCGERKAVSCLRVCTEAQVLACRMVDVKAWLLFFTAQAIQNLGQCPHHWHCPLWITAITTTTTITVSSLSKPENNSSPPLLPLKKTAWASWI